MEEKVEEKKVRKLFRCLEMTDSELLARIVAVLAETGPLRVRELATLTNTTYPRVATAVKTLEALGVIYSDVERSGKRGRPRKILWLSEEGLERLIDVCVRELSTILHEEQKTRVMTGVMGYA